MLVGDLAEEETLDGPLTVGPAVQVRADGPRRWLRLRRDEVTAAELIAAVSARYHIRDLTIEEPGNIVPPPLPQDLQEFQSCSFPHVEALLCARMSLALSHRGNSRA
jgi:hypothetical protein